MKSKMAFSAVLFFLSITQILRAQAPVTPNQADSSVSGITYYFYFVNGYALACKVKHNANTAYRLRLDFSGNYSNYDFDKNYFSNGTQNPNVTTGTTSSNIFQTSISADYVHDFIMTNKGEAYFAAGPFVSYTRSNSKDGSRYFSYPGFNQDESTRYVSSIDIGLSLYLGMEAYLFDNFRVFAESQLSGGKSWGKTETESISVSPNYPGSTSKTTWTSDRWFYKLTSVRLGVGFIL